jgi:hypothetical protein
MPSLDRIRKQLRNKEIRSHVPSDIRDWTEGQADRYAKTNWKPGFLYNSNEPLFPRERISWQEFESIENQSGYEGQSMTERVDRLARRGLLNIDIESLRGTNEYYEAKEFIKMVNDKFYDIHGGGNTPLKMLTKLYLAVLTAQLLYYIFRMIEP